jgi:hypothetical protein
MSVFFASSFTMVVKLYVPTTLGVPEITPEGLSFAQEGSAPSFIDQV